MLTEFEGRRIPIWSQQRGIFRPKELRGTGIALSVQTSFHTPYDDRADPSDDRFVYKYQGTDVTREVKQRLHQRRFRYLVISAYRERCAMCSLRHEELLDAAHILPDRDERGSPEVPNGLSLCRIHHGAYDVDIVGIDPDYRLHVREDVLEEIDGPMLRHGLQEMHGGKLIVPRREGDRPNRDYLAERFERFEAA